MKKRIGLFGACMLLLVLTGCSDVDLASQESTGEKIEEFIIMEVVSYGQHNSKVSAVVNHNGKVESVYIKGAIVDEELTELKGQILVGKVNGEAITAIEIKKNEVEE